MNDVLTSSESLLTSLIDASSSVVNRIFLRNWLTLPTGAQGEHHEDGCTKMTTYLLDCWHWSPRASVHSRFQCVQVLI